jgi:hypothetical protein
MRKNSMKSLIRTITVATLLALLVVVGASAAHASDTIVLGSSSQIPAAEGTAKFSKTTNGNIELELRIKHLAPPSRIVPGAVVFVVWVRDLAAGSQAQNLGALKVDKNLSARFKSVTSMAAFDVFLTCEQSQTTTVSTPPELLSAHYATR